MKIQSVYIFIKLVELELNFKEAQKILSLPRTTIWNHVSDLEKSLNKLLINRKRQSLTLTTHGEEFIPNAYRLYEIFEESLLDDSDLENSEIEGNVLISATQATALGWSMDSIKNLLAEVLNLKLKIIASDKITRDEEKAYDVLVRPFYDSTDFKKLWYVSYNFGLFASQEYIDKYGMPKTPGDLIRHKIIGYGDTFSYIEDIDWHLKGSAYGLPKLSPTLSINVTKAIYEAAKKGMGICSTPIESNSFYKGQLIRVLPEITGPTVNSYFCVKKTATRRKLKNIDVANTYFRKYLTDAGFEVHML